MFVIGLTGGIGTGKSAVAAVLHDLGAEVIDADLVGHQVYLKGAPGWRQVVSEFGRQVLSADGEVDRDLLGAVVFGDRQVLRRLNEIVHPLARVEVEEQLGEMRRGGVEVAVVEAILLVEAGWASFCDEVWMTVASEKVALRRVMRRSRLDAEAVRVRIRSQTSQRRRLPHADVTIENEGDLEQLLVAVRTVWNNRIPISGIQKKGT